MPNRHLHIFHEPKFLRITKYQFSAVGYEENIYLVLDPDFKGDETSIGLSDEQAIKYIIRSKPRSITLHYLGGRKARILIKSAYEGPVHWSSWGADIYNSMFGIELRSLLEKKTLNFVFQHHNFEKENRIFAAKPGKRKLLLKTYKLLKGEPHAYDYIKMALQKVTSYSTVLPTEQNIVAKHTPNIKYVAFCYMNLANDIPETLKEFQPTRLGQKILVGNSSAPSLNHIDVLKVITDEPILIPLSYGSEAYKNGIMKDFSSRSGIEFLVDFLPYEDYLRKLTSCNTLIIYSKRQQAIANIVLALYLGMRVYLHGESPTLDFLRELGCSVFVFDVDFVKYKNNSLTEAEVRNNRMSIEKYWGVNANKKRMKKFIQTEVSS